MKRMNLVKIKVFYSFLLLLALFLFGSGSATVEAKSKIYGAPELTVKVHAADYGDMKAEKGGGGVDGKRLEGFTLNCDAYPDAFKYRLRTKDGWSAWKTSGSFVGSTGQSMPVHEVEVKITNKKLEEKYDIYLRSDLSHDIGWTDYGANVTGTTLNCFYIERFQIRLVNKANGEPAPSTDSKFPAVVTVSPYENAMLGLYDNIYIWQVAWESFSHHSILGCDITSNEAFLTTPFSGRITSFSRDFGKITYASDSYVMLPNGECSYLTLTLLHGKNFSQLEKWYKEGTVLPQGVKFYEMGRSEKNGSQTGALHHELRVSYGSHSTPQRGDVYPFDALFVDPSATITNPGKLYSGNCLTDPSAPSDWTNRWVKRANIPYGAEVNYATVKVVTNDCILRSTPAKQGKVIANKIPSNSILCAKATIRNASGNLWYYVENESYTGWIYEGHLRITEENNVTVSNMSTPTGNLRYGAIFVIKGRIVNLSNTPMKLTVRCLNSAGQVCFTYTETINNSVELQGSVWDNKATFNALKRGSGYKYQVIAGDKILAESTFNVM